MSSFVPFGFRSDVLSEAPLAPIAGECAREMRQLIGTMLVAHVILAAAIIGRLGAMMLVLVLAVEVRCGQVFVCDANSSFALEAGRGCGMLLE